MSVKFTSVPTKILTESILPTATSFRVNNITGWNGVDLTSAEFGARAFGVFRNPTNTQIEFFEWDPSTIASSSITIVSRGLKFDAPDLTTEVTANKLAWTANDTFVDLGTDTPQMLQFLKEYIDAAAIAGAVPATELVPGIVKTATSTIYDAGTDDDGTYKYIPGISLLQSRNYLIDSGSANTYVLTPSPAITSYVAGQRFTFKAANANTSSSTLNISGLGAKTIKRPDGAVMLSGNIVANQIMTVIYDGTDFIVISDLPAAIPQVSVFSTVSTFLGSSTTQFDISNTSGNTYRYTWDATGTDPGITSSNPVVGAAIDIQAQNFAAGNKGKFIVTNSGTNFFEIANASGVAETNKTIGTGYVAIGSFWTKDPGLKYVIVELVAGGGGGGYGDEENPDDAGAGGGGGGYARKLISAASLGSTEVVTVGPGGAAGTSSTTAGTGSLSAFGTHCSATGGGPGLGGNTFNSGGAGGTGSGGDINCKGGGGGVGADVSSNSGGVNGVGGSSLLGGGAAALQSGNVGQAGGNYGGGGSGGNPNLSDESGGDGAQGVVIVTEYYA